MDKITEVELKLDRRVLHEDMKEGCWYRSSYDCCLQDRIPFIAASHYGLKSFYILVCSKHTEEAKIGGWVPYAVVDPMHRSS